jgi:hypothetical protein
MAVALEATSPLLFSAWGHGDLPYEFEVVLEEGLELGGWILIAAGIATTLVTRNDS